jgi:hypothetical protein
LKKRKVKYLVVTFDDGTSDEFALDGTMSESLNSRKKAGFKNLQEWVEYHITWFTLVQDLEPVEPVKTPEDLEAESLARIAEKMKNPLYAGTQDGRDFYKTLPENWETLFRDFITPKENGQSSL